MKINIDNLTSIDSKHESYEIEKNIFRQNIHYDEPYFNLFLCSLLKPNAFELILNHLQNHHLTHEEILDIMISSVWLKHKEIFKYFLFDNYNLLKDKNLYIELEKIKHYDYQGYLNCHLYIKIIQEQMTIAQIVLLKTGELNEIEDWNQYKFIHDDVKKITKI